MRLDTAHNNQLDLSTELPFTAEVHFNSERLCLEGSYGDEISAYRARRSWKSALESLFLLEYNDDFELVVEAEEGDRFCLECRFLTACARYAFWRLTNQQAPEAQYLIETGHIPMSDSRPESMISAPDLCDGSSRREGVMGEAPGHAALLRVREFLGKLF